MSGIYGIQFPKNNGDNNTAPGTMIWYPNPQSNGLPIWGPSNAGVTVVRRIYPNQPNADSGGGLYNAMFWWSNTSGFVSSGDIFAWNDGSSDSYWGFHLYPTGGSPSHDWEVATQGRDDVLNRSGNPVHPTFDTFYIQGIRVLRNSGTGLKDLTSYLNLPSTANADVIDSLVDSAGWGETTPPNPGIVIGDSPWYSNYQHERFAGIQGEIKIFAMRLSEADMISEASDFTQIMTANGESSKWWCKNGFSDIDDLSGDLGTSGIAFQWWDSGNKGTLVDIGAGGGGGSAALTGTVISSITETDIVAGTKTAIITLTGDTFIP